MSSRSKRQDRTVKLISLLLSVGGAAGVLLAVWTEVKQLVQSGARPSVSTAIMGVFVVIFGLSTWTGIDLWRGKQHAYKWAKILFAAQIPQVSLPGFVYQFYSAAALPLAYSRQTDSKLGINFELGSSIALWSSPQAEDIVLGVNLVALVALIMLIKAKPASQPVPTT